MQVLMGTRENAALFGLLLCLPTAPTLPLSSQDTGTSGWQLVDKATLLAHIGKGGGPMSLAGTSLTYQDVRYLAAFGGKADTAGDGRAIAIDEHAPRPREKKRGAAAPRSPSRLATSGATQAE